MKFQKILIPKFNKIHNRFKLNGVHYSHENLKTIAYNFVKEGVNYEKSIGNFLLDWLGNKNYILVKTSGSTATPKIIKLNKQAMVNSAIATGNFFKLRTGNTALHCLPTEFIAGKMMLVRAFILGLELDLVEPSSSPLKEVSKKYHFCAMTPFQVKKSLNNLNIIKTLIIGGAQVSNLLKAQLQNKRVNAFETYGMTETITHVAAKRLNNFKQTPLGHTMFFKALPNIKFEQDKRNCLIIRNLNICKENIVTNDVVKLHSEQEFEWLGRIDNIINSGGIKLIPEEIESKLNKFISRRFFIASLPDEIMGNKLILVIECSHCDIEIVSNNLKKSGLLDAYEIPKKIITLPKFIETASGKIQRKKTLALLEI